MVDQTTEVSNTEQMDENLFKEFLSKNSVWDFHNMTRDEYTTKSNNEKELLVLKYYNEMVKGKIWYFILVWISLLWVISWQTFRFKVWVNIWFWSRSSSFKLISYSNLIRNVFYIFPKMNNQLEFYNHHSLRLMPLFHQRNIRHNRDKFYLNLETFLSNFFPNLYCKSFLKIVSSESFKQ